MALALSFLLLLSLSNGLLAHHACEHGHLVNLNQTNADFLIGGIFPLHYENKSNIFQLNEPGITWVEAFRFAIEEINRDENLLPNITLGYHIYDSCNKPHIAMNATLKMIKQVDRIAMTSPHFPHIIDFDCNCKNKSGKQPVVGIVGDASSLPSIRVASILAASYTPQISYSSTSTELSNKAFYPSFLRTIPTDTYQAFFIADVLKHFGWKYVNIIGSDNEYGRAGTHLLKEQLDKYEICTAVYELVDAIKNNEATERVVLKLKKEKKATVIVLWCDRQVVCLCSHLRSNN